MAVRNRRTLDWTRLNHLLVEEVLKLGLPGLWTAKHDILVADHSQLSLAALDATTRRLLHALFYS